mgnify:CR=1 FL=1
MMEEQLKQVGDIITAIRPVIERLSKDKKETLTDIAARINKITDNGVKVLVCGEFKRGKSSFVNALLGRKLCAVDQDICTSVVSIIRYSKEETVLRYYGELSNPKQEHITFEELQKYTVGATDEVQSTIFIEIGLPLERLKRGVVLIDTPGVGGLDPRHALLTTYFLPQADITLFMTDVNEPLTTTELDFYKNKVSRYAKHSAVIVNKCDLKESASVEEVRLDTLKKISEYCKIPAGKMNVITVSSRKKQMFDKSKVEKLYQDSNFNAVEKEIERLILEFEKVQLSMVCSDLDDLLGQVVDPLKTQLNHIEVPDPAKIAEVRQRQMEMQEQMKVLNDPTSDFRIMVQKKIAQMREDVINNLNEQSILFSSNGLSSLIQSEEAQGQNAGTWIEKQINDALSAMSAEVILELRRAFDCIATMPEFQGMLKYTVKNVDVTVRGKKIVGEVPLHKRLMACMPGVGLGFIANSALGAALGFLGIAAAPVLAPVAAIAIGLGVAVKSHSDTERAAKFYEIKEQFQPQIAAAMQQLRTFVEMRFNEFQQEWIKVVSDRVKNYAADMQELVNSLNKLNADHKSALSAKMGIERLLNPLDVRMNELHQIMKNNHIENNEEDIKVEFHDTNETIC